MLLHVPLMWNTFENTIRAQVAPVVNLRLRPYCAPLRSRILCQLTDGSFGLTVLREFCTTLL